MTNFNDLIIFEMANSHQGDVQHGINIIKSMAKIARSYGIRAAVKLQYRELDTFIHPAYKGRQDIKHIPRFESTRLNYDEFCQLVNVIREEGLIAMSTPFDEIGVQWCVEQGLDFIKIASCSSMDWPLMEAAAESRKPLIVSVGGKSIADIDKIYNFLVHRGCEFAFMHCIAEYPAPDEHIQLDFLDTLRKRYRGITLGYSGHENPDDTIIPSMAIAKGAQIMERHVGLPTETISLNAYSMNPEQASKWVETIVHSRKLCALGGGDTKYVSQNEIDSLLSLSRGVFAKHTIKNGDMLHLNDVFFAMPCKDGQMTSSQFYDGMIVTHDYSENDALYEVVPYNEVKQARSVIHDAKGLLLEAGIELGDSFEVELSHHYGMQRFRQTGAIIIGIINREYCKKLIIVLPGQNHPEHYHKIKEETFQVLYGDLECIINGEKKNLKAGDIQTVLRGDVHSFSSRNGAVFEEVSTTHVKNDSYYIDPVIAKKDIMERKTIIKDW